MHTREFEKCIYYVRSVLKSGFLGYFEGFACERVWKSDPHDFIDGSYKYYVEVPEHGSGNVFLGDRGPVGVRKDDCAEASSVGGYEFLLHAADRQNVSSQRYLAGAGEVAPGADP